MDEVELTAAVRIAARISDTHPDYSTGRIRQELTDALRTIFQEPIKRAGNGYGQQLLETPLAVGTDVYRIPPRALVAGLVTVEAAEPGGQIRPMVEVTQRDHADLVGSPGEPNGFVDNADFLRLVPSVSVGGWTLRQWYKLRASKIVEKQATNLTGKVTAVDPVALTITVAVLPVVLASESTLATNDTIDVIAPNGSHELHLVSILAEDVTGLVITVPAGTDLSRIQIGDFVRGEEESEWPTMLPQEFHRTLADAAAVVILSDMGTVDKAMALASKVQSDVERLKEMLEPRVRDLATPFVPRYGVLRAHRRWTPPARL